MKKKFVSLFIALAVLFSMAPAAVFAAESTEPETEATAAAEEVLSLEAADPVYALVNIPYSVFYGAEAATFTDNVDAVSSATNKTGNYGKAGGSWHSGTSAKINEDGIVTAIGGETGSQPQGVIWAVKADSLEAIKALGGQEITDASAVTIATVGRGQATSTNLHGYQALVEASAYSYYVLQEAPAYYATLADGTFSAVAGDATVEAPAEVSVSYDSNWGDIQLGLTAEDAANTIINAMVITAVDANGNETKAGLYHLDQIWAAGEIGWRVAVTPGLDNKTITNIRYYCSVKDADTTDPEVPAYVNYIYDYPTKTALSQVYTGEVTAEFTDAGTIELTGLPADATNVKAKVYNTTGGRNAIYTYLTPLAVDPADDDIDPETVSVTDGKISLSKELVEVTNSKGETKTYGKAVGETKYTIELSSDNYIITKISAEYSKDVYYVQMNVPYTDFYAAYNLTDKAVWEVETGVDAVSTATQNKFLGTTGLAKGTYNDGTYILGVTIPVKVSKADYKNLDKKLTEKDNYYFSDLAADPAYYAELTVSDGEYSFSKIQDTVYSTDYLTVDGLVMDENYGDYQITLTGFSNVGEGIQISNSKEDNLKDYVIYGAVMTLNNGTYGMTCLENLWFGGRVDNAEIAWSIPEGRQLQRAHGNGGLFYQFENTNGADLKSVDVITNYGTFHLTKGSAIGKLKEYYPGDLSNLSYSLANDSKELTISGIPSDLTEVKITVGANKDTLVSQGTVENGKVALGKAPTAGTTYTLTIASGNYPDITRTLSTPATDDQKAELKTWAEKAKAASGYADDKDLQEHVAEAEALIADKDASSAAAAELITELQEKTKKHYPIANVEAVLTESLLALTLVDADLADLENPVYTISSAAGRRVTVLESGALTSLNISLASPAVFNTEYTVKIESDNYQDIVTTVTIGASKIEVQDKTAVYTGKAIASATATVIGSNGVVTYTYYSDEAATKEIAASKVKAVGTYYVKATVAADGNYQSATSDVAKITISKAANKVTKIAPLSKTYKAKNLKKKKATIKLKATVKNKAAVTFKATVPSKAKKYISVSSKGVVTVKKGTPVGTYKVKVTATSKATANYKSAKLTKTVTINVKK